MNKKWIAGGIVGAIALALLAFMAIGGGTAQAAVEIGEEMPDFTLTSTDGKEHTLSDHKGQLTVLIFTSQHCPWVVGSNKQMKNLEKDFEGKGVVFLHIDSDANTAPSDIAKYLDENDYSFTVLKDPENKYADKVNAQRTPEVFVVDKDGKLAYHGAYDNRKSPPDAGDTNYTADAINALLKGEEIANSTVRAWGCTINRVAR